IDQAESLHALKDLGSPLLSDALRQALSGPPSFTTSTAIDVASDFEKEDYCDEIKTALSHIDSNGKHPLPYIWCKAAEYLLRRGRESGIKHSFRRVDSNCLGDVAILTLEFFPDVAVETFRRALRSKIPCNRITAAAVLAIIDQPWSRTELAKVLEECHDHEMTSECRSALMTTHSEEAHRRVQEWESRHPRQTEEGPYISMTEMSLRMSDETINYEMEKLHDRVLPL
ncbi:unnamed protein product, partial [Ectocarpus sp. 4 AP-2014]